MEFVRRLRESWEKPIEGRVTELGRNWRLATTTLKAAEKALEPTLGDPKVYTPLTK